MTQSSKKRDFGCFDQYNLPQPIKLLAAHKCFGREEGKGSGVVAIRHGTWPRPQRDAAFVGKSAVLELLESFPDQLLKLLRLRDEGLHPVLSKLRLKRHNLLEILCLGDLFDQG